MRILLTDDDLDSRRALRAALLDMGYSVTAAASGEEAWELFKKEPCRIVVSDWVMPGRIDGLALCRLIRGRQDAEYSYFMMVTALMTERGNYFKAMDQGVDDFLMKPVQRDDLWIRLRVAERMLGLRTQLLGLSGAIPICSYCKRMKNADGAYEDVEVFLEQRANVSFTHGICPACRDAQVLPLPPLPAKPSTRLA